ncbi:malonic semialdehyde reductase [Catellatospora sp. TT07R-123]|uniref:malonic semialdehyde reductase n=1 Tax=Catellatospora sp. TT07R-123 TaxID=2733863 RepID=UPI001BB310D9|nr:malonic semialdehyde reductase [Catellatospora sp. TT07R-123]
MTAPPVTALPEQLQDLLFRQPRTAHAFAAEPVTEEQIQLVHDLARYGPTAFNSQPLRVVLVRSAAARERLLPHLSSGNRAKTAAAPLVAVLAADTGFPQRLPELFPYEPRAAEWFADPAQREHHARLNAALQAGYFLIAVRAAGLAAGPMSGFDPAGVDAAFFPDGRLRSFLVVLIGHPAAGPGRERPPRLGYDDVVSQV